MKRLFILADNQDITRAGLRMYIHQLFVEENIQEVHTKKELVALLLTHEESVVVLDYTLFDIADVEELIIIAKRFPNAHWLLISDELTEGLVRRLSVEPMFSIVMKGNSSDEIRAALRSVATGEHFLCHQITNLLLNMQAEKSKTYENLTASEVDILKYIALGRSVKEIASLRNSSVNTIITHKKNIFRKLEVNNVHEATKYAIRAGLIELAEYYI